MPPFSIPAPLIIPLRLPVFGGPKSIDSKTKIQLLCETYLDHEIFYTVDGTKPQPYARIVQGSKTIKYTSPFYLVPGKNTIRAIAINANIHSMCSNVVTKCFEVLKAEGVSNSGENQQKRRKQVYRRDSKKSSNQNIKASNTDDVINKCNSKFSKSDENNGNCFDDAFINTLDDEVGVSNLEDSVDEKNDSSIIIEDESENSVNLDESEEDKSFDDPVDFAASGHILENSCEIYENSTESHIQNGLDEKKSTFNINELQSAETQFCCLKCDMTLQQCVSCRRMNAVSSKYCIECGTKLTELCFYCKTHNPSIAIFCQCCGNKLNTAIDDSLDACRKVDCCVMAQPKVRNAGIQKIPILINKCTQTFRDVTSVRKSSPKFNLKQIPQQSPGRGYWHQQMDYICNHIKSHAYNNLEFRKTISEPVLGDFQSANVTKNENCVAVSVVFSSFNTDKRNFSETEESKSKGSS